MTTLVQTQVFWRAVVHWKIDVLVVKCTVRILSPACIPYEKFAIGGIENWIWIVVVGCEHSRNVEAIFRMKLIAFIKEFHFYRLVD